MQGTRVWSLVGELSHNWGHAPQLESSYDAKKITCPNRDPTQPKELIKKNYLLPKYSCGTGIEYHSYIIPDLKGKQIMERKKKITSKNSEIQLGKH